MIAAHIVCIPIFIPTHRRLAILDLKSILRPAPTLHTPSSITSTLASRMNSSTTCNPMGRVKSGQTRARGQQKALLEQPAVTTKRENANKKALRRAESNASFLSQSPLAMFSDAIYIREQWRYQRSRRHAKELAELRNKRRWVQGQLDDGNVDGSTARELLKLCDKTYFGKPQGQRPRVEDMSGGAKLVNQHLEHPIEHRLGAFGDDAGDQSHGAGSTAGPVGRSFDGMDGFAVKDEKEWEEGEEDGEEEEEWNVFSFDEEEREGFS